MEGHHKFIQQQYKADVVDVFWRAVPGTLTAAAPHRRGTAAQGTRMVDKWYSMHDENGRREERIDLWDCAIIRNSSSFK